MKIFNAKKIMSYEDFSSFIECEKIIFNTERNKIFEKYDFLKPVSWDKNIERYQLFRNEYQKLVQTEIKKVIAKYRKLLPEKLFIAEFGSFVKRTERIYSDIDFTICYDEPKDEVYECTEEMIDYSIASILGYSIDHVHSNFQHYPKHPEFDSLSEKDNMYIIVFSDGNVEYKCGPETLAENLTHIVNVRDYKTLFRSFEIKYEKKADIDSLYSIEILENNTEHNFLADLSLLESMNNICEGYNFITEPFILKRKITISELKNCFKYHGIVQFYIFISSIRKIVSVSTSYSMNMEQLWNNDAILKLFGKRYLEQLHLAYITFIFYWNRIEYSLIKRGIALSSRCYKILETTELNEILEEDWGKNTDIQGIVSSRNEFVELIREGVVKLKQKS